jgi:hypothetical protein
MDRAGVNANHFGNLRISSSNAALLTPPNTGPTVQVNGSLTIGGSQSVPAQLRVDPGQQLVVRRELRLDPYGTLLNLGTFSAASCSRDATAGACP